MRIGDRLRELRLERGLTQQELADMSYINRSYVAQIEAGRKVPRPEVRVLIAAALDVEEAELTGAADT